MVVLTGATRGIGRAAAVELARRGAEVAIVGRDADRVREVAEEAGAHGHVADLAQMDDVRRLAGELLERYPRIDVLANNAGAMFTSRHVTSDGFEQTFALNHLSPFLLTSLLRDRLVESRGRVVTTSSDAHRGGLLDLGDLQSEHGRFKAMSVYGTTKLCNIAFTHELARKLEGTRVIANALHPGFVATRFGDQAGGFYAWGVRVAKLFAITPEEGAETMVYLASSPDVARTSGGYFEKSRPSLPSREAQSDEVAQRLWTESERLAGISW